MATSSTKKGIIDYLWEWGEQNGEWGKLLVSKIVGKEAALSVEDREEVYGLFLHTVGLKKEVEKQEITRPDFQVKGCEVKLQSLHSIEGVNKLAKEQSLDFSDNVTVVYGETGTGKTGYGRILKALGFCYEKGTRVLPNIYDNSDVEQTATISFTVDGEEREFIWDGSNIQSDLHRLSVFTNDCVKLSLSSNRELLVTPIGFHLFTLLSGELMELEKLNTEKANGYKTEIVWSELLHEGTTAYEFIENLNHDSSADELKKLSTFTSKDGTDLKELGGKLKGLNKKLIETEITALTAQFKEVSRLKMKIFEAQKTLTETLWDNLKTDLASLETLEGKEKMGLKDIAEQRGIELYESEEFQRFIKSADNYIKKLGNENYPENSDETCIYCKQELTSADSLELLKNYRVLLNDTTQEDITKVKERITNFYTEVRDIETNHVLHQPSYGQNEKNEPIQPKILTDYNDKILAIQKLISNNNKAIIKIAEFDIEYSTLIQELTNKAAVISKNIKIKRGSLSNLTDLETGLKEKINELLDRKKLGENSTEVKVIISNLKVIHLLHVNNHSFNTLSVSKKTTAARTDLIAETFNDTFQEELKKLKRSNIKVNLAFKTDRGKSKLVQHIESGYELSDILSEGEQKAVALAEFMTELKLDKTKAPVIFDDPVTSLDHHIIDEVARRLVNLSKERQVVIFTHSILLFNSIKQKSEQPVGKGLDFIYYQTQKDLENTGYLYESPTLKEDSYRNYAVRINEILQTPKEERLAKENDLAIEGYNKLRAAIEVIVENDILHNSVKRYRKNVALTAFEKIHGELIDKHKENLNAIFERCCYYIDAHSNADGLTDEPDLEGLEIDFNTVKEIRLEFINPDKAKTSAVKVSKETAETH